MEIPKYYETFIPNLSALKHGEPMHYRELSVAVRDQFYGDLSPEQKSEKYESSNKNILIDRITWGQSYLKHAKFLNSPKRGFIQITQKGLKILEKGSLTLEELKQDPDFVAREKAKAEKKKNSQKQDEIVDESTASPQDLINAGFSKIEAEVKSELLERLKVVNPYRFEVIILELLEAMGYGEFVETPKSGDGGIDGIVNQDALGIEKIYIQAKRFNENQVREKDIRNFIGAMSGDTPKGIFVTTSSFHEGAVLKAKEAHHRIILIDGMEMVDLMHKYNVGVEVKETYSVKEIDEDFFEGF